MAVITTFSDFNPTEPPFHPLGPSISLNRIVFIAQSRQVHRIGVMCAHHPLHSSKLVPSLHMDMHASIQLSSALPDISRGILPVFSVGFQLYKHKNNNNNNNSFPPLLLGSLTSHPRPRTHNTHPFILISSTCSPPSSLTLFSIPPYYYL